MRKTLSTLAVAAVLASSAPAFANDADTGFYGVFGMQQSETKNDLSVLTELGVAVDKKDNGYNFNVGYKLNKNVAFEFGYVDFGDMLTVGTDYTAAQHGAISYTYDGNTYALATGAAGNITLKEDIDAFTLAAVFTQDVTDEFDVFGKAGFFRWDANATATITNTSGTAANLKLNGSNATGNQVSISESASGTDFFWGVGASYDIDENMAVRADFTRYKLESYGENQKIDSIGAALVVKF